MYNKAGIQYRIKYLFLILQFTKNKPLMLSDGKRICINQEIGSLLHKYRYSHADYKPIAQELDKELNTLYNQLSLADFRPEEAFPYDEILT